MKTFNVDYYETYHGVYTVGAETIEEAKENLKKLLMYGYENAPDCCCGSGFFNVTEVEE